MGLSRNADGRPILTGASVLPPMFPRMTAGTDGGKHTGKPDKAKRKTADRFGVLNAFVDTTMGELSRSEIAVWLVLYRDTRNGSVRVDQRNVARRAGMSQRSVVTATKKLVQVGLLIVIYQGGLNKGPSRYRVESLMKRTS